MLVYILSDNEIGKEYIVGVFETKAKALDFASRYGISKFVIKEFEVKK